jgi:hypothetical protein
VSILKPEGSLMAGLATAAMVYGTYTFSLPNGAMISATDPQDIHVEAGRRKAAIQSAAVVGIVSLIAKDKTIFVLGGLMLIALDWHARIANASSPQTGKVVSNTGYQTAAASVPDRMQGVAAYS